MRNFVATVSLIASTLPALLTSGCGDDGSNPGDSAADSQVETGASSSSTGGLDASGTTDAGTGDSGTASSSSTGTGTSGGSSSDSGETSTSSGTSSDSGTSTTSGTSSDTSTSGSSSDTSTSDSGSDSSDSGTSDSSSTTGTSTDTGTDTATDTGTDTGGDPDAQCDPMIPIPTAESLEADDGPLAVSTYVVPSAQGYGAGTITYPTDGGPYPSIVVMPGYTGTQQTVEWVADRLAPWGFVVIVVDTNNPTDNPDSRGTQIQAAATQLLALSDAGGNPIEGKVNGIFGVVGHSMGGGGTMVALRDDDRFLAGVPMAPYHTSPNFSGIDKPTFFLICGNDNVAAPSQHADVWYPTMSMAEKLYVETPGDHLCVQTTQGQQYHALQGKWLLAWFSYWLCKDDRFETFLCGDESDADKDNTTMVTNWMDTCAF